jgi:beta-phosphoglucomutase-like phosphatase (HAD superfamily)
MADTTDSQQVEQNSQAAEAILPRALLFELENVSLAGRKAAYVTMERILAEKNVVLNFGLFAKHCIPMPPAMSIPAIIDVAGDKRISSDKLVAGFGDAYKTSVLSSDCAVNNAIVKLVAEAKARDIAVGSVSMLSVELAGAVAERVGIREDLMFLLANAVEDRNYPSADAWLKLAKELSVPPGLCVAVATSSGSCRAALSAGMSCVVIPDQHTSFQDFGGASFVAESLDRDIIESIFSLLDDFVK